VLCVMSLFSSLVETRVVLKLNLAYLLHIRQIRNNSERRKKSDLFLFVLSTAFFLLARCIQQQMFSSTLHLFAGVHLLRIVQML
jgi:hypothetical protein